MPALLYRRLNAIIKPKYGHRRGFEMDNTTRFDGKGEIYAKARPKYAAGLFEHMKFKLNIP